MGLDPTGYLHPRYAESLAAWGSPCPLPRSGAWLIERDVPGCPHRKDAMHCYPVLVCRDWAALSDDLFELGQRWVSLVVVVDPLAPVDEAHLRRCFPDLCRGFKTHYVVDFEQPLTYRRRKSTRRQVKRGLEALSVERCSDPLEHLDAWVDLYEQLAQRRRLGALHRFSREAFALQLTTPGLEMFCAKQGDEVVGIDLWYVSGDVAYGHLAAYSEQGYRQGASYVLNWEALESFSGRLRWADLGGAPGLDRDEDHGLSRFKRGWSNARKTAFLCGRVCDPAVYEAVSAACGQSGSGYFPAYRTGERSGST